ncbi:shikimate kinase [Mitsuokella sp.]|uniref:shikimate kinase n=1 Tax=unclassified Mitsuokella TaxID=2637239 RepID=UPI003D7C5F07
MKNVVLIGFMGTGKTSTGRVLAQKLGISFLDLDQEIEKEYGMAIPDMFAKKGEAYFRSCEHAMVEKAAKRQNTVISTGGGTVKDPKNMEALRRSGVVVCLQADVDTILARTASKGERPVLDKEDRGDRRRAIEKLIAERRALYKQADFSVDTSRLSPLQVVDEILHYLKLRGVLHA